MSTSTEEKTGQRAEWPWVAKLREAGFDVRVGTGGPLQREPAAMFPPYHPSLRERMGDWLIRLGERVRGYSDDD